MSCNGCRVLRKRCSERCALRSSIQWIDSPQAQAHATLFLAKFFGRSDLMFFISSVSLHHRPALFQSLLFEACGRTINPVNGAVGLLCSGKWHVCQAAVNTVLAGGVLRPLPEIVAPTLDEFSDSMFSHFQALASDSLLIQDATAPDMSLVSGESEMANYDIYGDDEKKLLNLFV
ncbi:LOB domain-containing protein 38 [Spatholobus suberectus]|nr:LOB domain-containing protein 38 [Spatholobus suberectus]